MTMKRLRFERKKKELSQRQLAQRADMAVQTVSAIECGALRGWPGQLTRLADALGYTGDPIGLTDDVDAEFRACAG